MPRLFGIDIFTGSRAEILHRASAMIGKGGVISTVNPEIMRNSLYDDKLRHALEASLNIPDGVGTKLALALCGHKTAVFPGIELGEALLDTDSVRFGIIGGAPGVAERAAARLSSVHRLAEPVLMLDGYSVTAKSAAKKIREASPDIVMVCMGSPKQETFIELVKGETPGVLFIALGGSADVYSGDKRRAPAFIRALRLEWAYRMAREPMRLLRAPSLFDFCIFALMETVIYRKIDKS